MTKAKKLLILAVIAITTLAVFVRVYATENLYIDYDEPIYLKASLEYTNFIRHGQANWLIWSKSNYEHPSLYKIVYGVVLLGQSPLEKLYDKDFVDPSPIVSSPAKEWGMAGRRVSLVFGSIAVLVLSIVNPLAGFFLAINSLSVKYTSQFYLEALPLLTSLLAIIGYWLFYKTAEQFPEKKRKIFLWLALSAVFLGITAASKYIYCAAGVAIALHWMIATIRRKIPVNFLFYLLGWGVFSLIAFYIFDPYLWPHPITHLIETLQYHLAYPNSENVKEYAYPVWQPLYWLWNPFRYFDPRSSSAFLFYLDPIIFILAIIGLPRTYQKKNIYFVWLIVGIIVLLMWGTKWPQYTLIVLAPFCMAASQGLFTIFELIKSLWKKWTNHQVIN